jgi:hypothetical protein
MLNKISTESTIRLDWTIEYEQGEGNQKVISGR